MLVDLEIDELEELIINELRGWTDDQDIIDLYIQMYERDGYCIFAHGNIQSIVDNDYINNTARLYPGDEAYNDIKTLYAEYGCDDISMRPSLNHGYEYIEAENKGTFLVRC